MVVPDFASGKALLLLREVHLPSWTNSQAIFLPQNGDLPTGFTGLFFAKLSQNPRQNLLLPPILPNFVMFCAHFL